MTENLAFPNMDVTEYESDNPLMNYGEVRLKTRYPEQGRAVNTKCTILMIVLSGKGKLVLDDIELQMKKGDVFHISKGTPYSVEGKLTLGIPSVPAWNPGQRHYVP